MTRGLAFLPDPRPPGYGPRLSRLRWKRAAAADVVADWSLGSSAREAVARARSWVLVRDASALPASERVPDPANGVALLAQACAPAEPAFVHTLRELEGVRRFAEKTPVAPAQAAAIAFRAHDFAPRPDETIEAYVERLLATGPAAASDPAFRVIRFEEPSDRERPELTRRLPEGDLRILDVGCGPGRGIGSARPRHARWKVTGIEKDRRLAQEARRHCDRVLEGDLREILPALASAGERFDALVFGDVLEHLENPVEALRAGRLLAEEGATLLASVPNVGHLSIVRDLLRGRFDPVPAGLLDAGHLRWFTRGSLTRALEEAGWRAVSIDGEPGAPPPDPEPLLALAAAWPEGDPESLMIYQWIAVASPA